MKTLPTPSVDVDAIINASVHDIITVTPLFTAFSKAEFKANRTYGPVVAPGVDLWIKTSATWTVKGTDDAYFSIKNGKISTNVDDVVGKFFSPGLVGTVDYINFRRTAEKYAGKIKNGAIIFSAADRKEELGCPGTKLTFQSKTETDKQEVETEVSFEIYFKQVPGAPVTYPVEDYDYLFNWRNATVTFGCFALVGLATLFAPELVALGTGLSEIVAGLFSSVMEIVEGALSLSE